MTRRGYIVAGSIAGVLVLAAAVLWAVNRRDELARALPAWLNPGQPPDGVAAELSTLTDAQSWAANRCAPMTASCAGRGAGRRVRRTYPDTLADSDGSFIRTAFEIGS